MLVFEELDVSWPHKTIDHESNQPVQVSIDLSILLQHLLAKAVFLREVQGHSFTNTLACKTHKVSIFGHCETTSRLVRDFDDWKLRQVLDDVIAVCVSKHFANGNHVLMDCGGSEVPIAHHLHKCRQLFVANLRHGHVTKIRQDAVVHPLQKDGDIGCCILASLDPSLQAHKHTRQQVGKFGALVAACSHMI